MSIKTTRELLFYELGLIRDAEDSGRRLFDFLALRVGDRDLVRIFRTYQEDSWRLLANVDSCLQALGGRPIQTPSQSVEGITERFEVFVRLQPSPAMLDQFAVDTAIRYSHVCVAGYKTLLDWAILMNESRCVQCLHDNLVRKQESAGKLEQFSHELGVRILAPA